MTDAGAAPAIDLYYWPTPNGWKVSILLEELGVPYRLVPVDIRKGAQFEPAFLAISPNNKIPAIVDLQPVDGGTPLSVFETAAIMEYLADKYGALLPRDVRGRVEVMQWVAWQVASLGPTAGQVHHFVEYADEEVPYAIRRFTREIERLYGVLDTRLAGRNFICGDYSIADIASWTWCRLWRHHQIDLEKFPNLKRWLETVGARPAVNKGFRIGNELREGKSTMTEEARKVLLDQGAGR
ncbi:MAG: glutathione S-transferase N-terminal domain-containing protein [Pseudomonadota bacterium]